MEGDVSLWMACLVAYNGPSTSSDLDTLNTRREY